MNPSHRLRLLLAALALLAAATQAILATRSRTAVETAAIPPGPGPQTR